MLYKIVRLRENKNIVSFLSPVSVVCNHFFDNKWYHCSNDNTCPVCSILPTKYINRDFKQLAKVSKLVAYAIVNGEEGIISLSFKQYIDPFVQTGVFDESLLLFNDFIIKTGGEDFNGNLYTKFKSIDKIKAENPRTKLVDKIETMGKPVTEKMMEELTVKVSKMMLTDNLKEQI